MTFNHNSRALLRAASIVTAYVIAFSLLDWLTLAFQEHPGIGAWCPPEGLGFALLLVFGSRYAPALALTSLISSFFIYRPPQPVEALVLWAIVLSLVYWTAAAILRHRVRIDWQLRSTRDVVWLVFSTLVVSAILAVISVAISVFSEGISTTDIVTSTLYRWMRETNGVLALTPLLLVYLLPWVKRFDEEGRVLLRWSVPRPTLATVGQTFALGFALYWVFGTRVLDEFQPLYLIALPLIWIALDHGLKGTTVGITTLNVAAMMAAWFYQFEMARLGELQLLILVSCVVGLFMGITVSERKGKELELVESERNFRNLADNALVGIFHSTSKGEIKYVNDTLVRMMGFDSAETMIAGGSVTRWQDPSSRRAFVEELQREGRVENYENVVLKANGEPLPTLVSAKLHDGEITGTILDLSERKRAESELRSSEEKFRGIIDASPVPKTLIDDLQHILYVNPAFTRIFGYAPEEIPTLSDWLPKAYPEADYRQRVAEIWQSRLDRMIGEGVPFEPMEVAIRCKDETRRTAIVKASPLSGSLTNIQLVTLFDITERKQAEEALERNQAMLAKVGRMAKVGGWELDIQTMTPHWSLETYRIHEVDPSVQPDLKNAIDFYAPEARPVISEAVQRCMEDGKGFDLELPFITATGRHIWVRASAEAELRDGKCMRIHGFFQDIDERKLAEEQTKRLAEHNQLLLDSVGDGIYGLDRNGVITFVNPAAAKIFGEPAETLVGVLGHAHHHHTKVDGSPYPREECPIYAALRDGKAHHIDNEVFWKKDGTSFPAEYTSTPLFDKNGHIVGAVVVFNDVTEVRRSQEDRLAREVAERANLSKSDFLSRMSHELRTPMNSILGFAQLLEMDVENVEHATRVRHILNSGKHLLSLINEVLDISRIESGRIQLSPETAALRTVLQSVFDIIQPLADRRGISVEKRIPSSHDIFVTVDIQRLKQVLINLLSNAVKFNREKGSITVSATLLSDGFLHLAIEDTGDGIPAEKLHRLFTAFDRLDADPNQTEGTGLGLVLSKGLIEAMGGRIGAQSVVGTGSIFWVDLRLTTQETDTIVLAEVDDILRAVPKIGSGLVLCVDDNRANLALIEKIMQRLPNVVTVVAMDGMTALTLAKERRPDAILLDIDLPAMNGWEVLRRLRANPATNHIPVIMASAHHTPSVARQALDAGARGCLAKPLDVHALLETIGDVLSRNRHGSAGDA